MRANHTVTATIELLYKESDAMICPDCKAEIPSGMRFCSDCGWKIPAYAQPEGFTYDPQSKQYFRSYPATDPQTGAAGNWMVWFNAETGEYRQQFYPSAPTSNAPPRTSPDTQSRRSPPASIPSRAAPPRPTAYSPPRHAPNAAPRATAASPMRGGKRGFNPFMLIPPIALVCGIGLAFALNGGSALPTDGELMEPPDSIERIELAENELPRFEPVDGASSVRSDRGNTDSPGNESSAADQSDNWAMLYAEFFSGNPFEMFTATIGEYNGTFPRHTAQGYDQAVMNVEFYEVSGLDAPVMLFTGYALNPDGAGSYRASPLDVAFVIRDDTVTSDKTEDERALIFPEGITLEKPVNGELLWSMELSADNRDGNGEEKARGNLQTLAERLAQNGGSVGRMESDAGEREAAAEAAGSNWAATYAAYLRAENFDVAQFDYFGSPAFLPLHDNLAVTDVMFYKIPGFDYPVMVLLEEFTLDYTPDKLEGTSYYAYIIKNGRVFSGLELDETDEASVYRSLEGEREINGEMIKNVSLSVFEPADVARDLIDAKFDFLYDWLDEQAANPDYALSDEAAAQREQELAAMPDGYS